MDRTEAGQLVADELRRLRSQPYADLVDALMNEPVVDEKTGASGGHYQLETQAIWDDKRLGHLRVMVSADDRGWRSFVPLTDDFIIAPDGSFIGEQAGRSFG